MDFHGNSVHQVGYRHPHVMAAVRRQFDTLPFSPRRYTNQVAVDLARKLAQLAPDPLGKVLFAPGGALAIGMALKLARVATGRHKTLSLWDSFHGASLDAISIGGEAVFRKGMGPLLPGTEHAPPCDPSSCRFGCGGTCNARCAEYLDYVLGKEEDIGAVIIETIRSTDVADTASRVLPNRPRRLRPPRHAPHPRRDSDLPRPHRTDVRLRALRHRSRHGRARQGPRWRRIPDGGADRPPRPRRRRPTARSATTHTKRARSAAPPRSRRWKSSSARRFASGRSPSARMRSSACMR